MLNLHLDGERFYVGQLMFIAVEWDLPPAVRKFWLRGGEGGNVWGVQKGTILRLVEPGSWNPLPMSEEDNSGHEEIWKIIPTLAGNYSLRVSSLDSLGRIEYSSEPVRFEVRNATDQERDSEAQEVLPEPEGH